MPVATLPGAQDKLPDQRLEHRLNLFQAAGQRPGRDLQLQGLEFVHGPLDRLLEFELLQ